MFVHFATDLQEQPKMVSLQACLSRAQETVNTCVGDFHTICILMEQPTASLVLPEAFKGLV